MEKFKNILIYLLVIFFAIFVGTSIFLILNNKKPVAEKTMASSVVPVTKPTEGSFNLSLQKTDINLLTDKEVKIDILADSNGKSITGYDLVLAYDPLAFEFVRATSTLADFKIYSYKRDGYLSFLATKTLQNETPSVFSQTKIADLVFKPIKSGKFNFSLKTSMSNDKTDLVTDQTEIISPSLNELEIEVK